MSAGASGVAPEQPAAAQQQAGSSGPQPSPAGPGGALQAVLERLQALRTDEAWQQAPVALLALEALAEQARGQPAAVQTLLLPRLQARLDGYALRLERLRADAAQEAQQVLARHPALARELRSLQATVDRQGIRRLAAQARQGRGLAPLAQLNASLRPAVEVAHDELASVRRFRDTWSRGRSSERVDDALAREPANPGPLNSHALLLRSLALMQTLSPDYLRRFLTHVEALQWLEAVGDKMVAKPAKAPKAAKSSKAAAEDAPAPKAPAKARTKARRPAR